MRELLNKVITHFEDYTYDFAATGDTPDEEAYEILNGHLTGLRELAKTAELRDELWAAAKEVGDAQCSISGYDGVTELTDRLNRRSDAVAALLPLCVKVAETET